MKEFESQIRECFGRVVYSHKTHEKCADIYFNRLRRIKFWTIAIGAVTTTDLIVALIGNNQCATAIGAALSAVALCASIYMKENDLGGLSISHKETADKLWEVRESYLSLLTDLRSAVATEGDLRDRRDRLQALLSSIYSVAPRTLAKAYKMASEALKVKQELTFTDAEIDNFLPRELRSTL